MMKALFSIILFTFCTLGFAQTNVSGTISSDITWSLADSPFTLTGSVLVSSGITLTIEPGVTVKVNSGLYIKVQGSLIAIGDESNKITFTSNEISPSKGDWDKIWLASTSTSFDDSDNYVSGTIFNHCIISYADEGLRLDDSSFYLVNCELTENNKGINFRKVINSIIDNNNFNNNGSGTSTSAGTEDNGVGSFTFTKFLNNTFKNNTGHGLSFGGYRNNANNNLIKNNTSNNNGGTGMYFGWGDVVRGFADNIIEGNIIYNNNGNGITVGRDSNVIKKNFIINNFGSGINISGTYIYEGLTIENNIISGNQGYGLNLTSNTNSIIRYNSILNSGTDNDNGNPSLGIPDSYITSNNNIITHNTIDGSKNNAIELRYGPNTFNNNNFIKTHGSYIIQLLADNDSDINAENNYWGTASESEIQAAIYDYTDDFELGQVDYTPFLTSLNIEAPISPPSNVTKSVSGSDVVLSWSANGESDIAGYKLHYGSPTGYSYATSVDLGNVTTYVVNGGDITTEYSITAYDSSIDGTDDMVDGNESWFSAANEVNITLMSSATSISEPTNSATLTVTLNSTSSQDIVVNLVYTGTAINATDYAGDSSITIAAGSLTGTIDVTAIDNTNIEVTKTIIIDVDTVTNASEEEVQQVSINLIDDDLPSVTLSYTPVTFNEAGGTSEIIATQSEITSNDTTINLDLSGTASNNAIIEDFETALPSGAIEGVSGADATIAADPATNGVHGDVMKIVTSTTGEFWQFGQLLFQEDSLDLTTDNKVVLVDVYSEIAFIILVKVRPLNGGAESGTDAAHSGSGWETLSFDFSNPKDNLPVADGIYGSIIFFPLWNGGNWNASSVTTTYVDNISAPNEGDYRISSRIINIPAGTSSATTTITGIEDSIFDEGDETIIITPVNPTNATLTSLEATTITITNKNYAPVALSNQNNHFSINVSSAGNHWETNLTQILKIIQGNTYTLTFDAWSDIDRSIVVGLGLSGNPDWHAIYETINITQTKTTYSFTFEPIGFGNPEARVLFDLGADIGQVNIDNVSLVTSTGENIVLNGDFSSGSDYWVNISNSSPAPVVSTIDYVSATEKIEVAITLVGVDSENDALTYVIETLPVNGFLTDPNNSDVVVSAGDSLQGTTVNYVSTSEIAEFDSFTFKVNDGELNSNTATISIAITAVNDPPVLSDDSITTEEDTSVNITLNVEDLDDTEFTYVIVSDVSNGSLSITNNVATYSPQEDFNGADSFTLIANDGEANSANAIISITVNAVNDAPVAVADTTTVDEGNTSTTLENGETSLLNNDTDAENNPLTAILVSDPIYGSLTLNSDGTFSYEHDGSDIASDYFTYKVNDGFLDSNIATVSIIINTVNDNFPTDIILSNNFIDENLSGIAIGQFTAEDLDLPADIHTFELVSGAGDTNNTSFRITDNNLIINESFDYETQQSLSIRVQVIDEVNQSFERSFDILINNVNDISITSAITDSYCSGTSGTGSITISSIDDTFGNLSFAWSAINGGSIPSGQEAIQSLTEISDGTYSVTISDTSFSLTESFEIGLTPQYDELSICYVSSDETDETKNRIFLNNAGNYNVGIYEILRETNSANIYTSIGSMLSTENSFLDENSDNMSQSYNYKVRLIDYCGNQSPNSDFHKTILLQSSIAVNNSVNLNWSDYEGTDFGTYNIFRNTNSEGFNLIGSVSASNNSFNDAGADITIDNYEYYISISVDECLNDVSVKSNSKSSKEIKSNRLLFSTATTSVDDFNDLNQLVVFPNPSNDMLNIKLSEGITLYKVKIYNTLGQMVLETQDLKFPIENLASSTYFIKVFTSKGLTTRNFIKN